MIYLHPQSVWRATSLRDLISTYEVIGLRMWTRRTCSGRNVLTLEPLPGKENGLNIDYIINHATEDELRKLAHEALCNLPEDDPLDVIVRWARLNNEIEHVIAALLLAKNGKRTGDTP